MKATYALAIAALGLFAAPAVLELADAPELSPVGRADASHDTVAETCGRVLSGAPVIGQFVYYDPDSDLLLSQCRVSFKDWGS